MPSHLEKAASPACRLSFLWQFYCIFLSFSLMLRIWCGLIVSVLECTNFLCYHIKHCSMHMRPEMVQIDSIEDFLKIHNRRTYERTNIQRVSLNFHDIGQLLANMRTRMYVSRGFAGWTRPLLFACALYIPFDLILRVSCRQYFSFRYKIISYALGKSENQIKHCTISVWNNKQQMSWNILSDIFTQRRLRSACADTQMDQSLRCDHDVILYYWLSKNAHSEDSDSTAQMRKQVWNIRWAHTSRKHTYIMLTTSNPTFI